MKPISFSYETISFSPIAIKSYEPPKIFYNYFFIIIGRVYVFKEFAFSTSV